MGELALTLDFPGTKGQAITFAASHTILRGLCFYHHSDIFARPGKHATFLMPFKHAKRMSDCCALFASFYDRQCAIKLSNSHAYFSADTDLFAHDGEFLLRYGQ